MRHSLKAGAATSGFAALFGLGPSASRRRAEEDEEHREEAARAEDDDSEKEDEEGAGGGEEGKKRSKAKGSKRADEEDGDGSDEEASAEEGEEERKEAKGSRRAEEGEDEREDHDEEMKEKGRRAERARWANVLKSPAALGRGPAACELLANSDMNAKAIIATLRALPAGATNGGLRERMASVKTPNVGSDGGEPAPAADGSKGLAAQILAAGRKRRGEAQ